MFQNHAHRAVASQWGCTVGLHPTPESSCVCARYLKCPRCSSDCRSIFFLGTPSHFLSLSRRDGSCFMPVKCTCRCVAVKSERSRNRSFLAPHGAEQPTACTRPWALQLWEAEGSSRGCALLLFPLLGTTVNCKHMIFVVCACPSSCLKVLYTVLSIICRNIKLLES